MKQFYIIIFLLMLNSIHLFPKTDSTYWIDKGDYKEINVKIGKVTFLKFSNDGKSLFTYGQDSILRKWDIENGIVLTEYFINTNPKINFNLSADETKFGYTSGDYTTRFDVFNLKNEFIHSFYQSYRNYQNPCPYDYQIAHKGMAVYMFHPYLNQIICETDYEITCPTDDLYFEHYHGGSFDFFTADSSGDYQYSSHPGSQKGSLAFSPDGNYTVYETGAHKHTSDMKTGESIDYKYYTEVIGDRNFNVITVLNSSVTGGWPGFDFRRRYVFSNDSKLMTYINNFLTIYKVPTGVIQNTCGIGELKIDIPEAIAFSKDNNNLVTGSNVNGISSIRYWNMNKKELVNYFDFPMKDMGWNFVVNKDSGYLITSSNDGILRMFKNISYKTLKADYYADSIDFYTNEDVSYHDNSSGAVKTRLWDFGDNTTSTEQHPIHRFKKSGSYTVELKVSNGIKADSTKKIYKVYDRIPNYLQDDKVIVTINNISISPNPASDYIEITMDNHTLKDVVNDIRIYDLMGVEVNRGIATPPAPSQEGVRINVSGLSPGVYFVRVGKNVKKFVKI